MTKNKAVGLIVQYRARETVIDALPKVLDKAEDLAARLAAAEATIIEWKETGQILESQRDEYRDSSGAWCEQARAAEAEVERLRESLRQRYDRIEEVMNERDATCTARDEARAALSSLRARVEALASEWERSLGYGQGGTAQHRSAVQSCLTALRDALGEP